PWTNNSVESAPYCVDNDPISRHFCMDADGKINPDASSESGTYQCDKNYDAMDYAMDMTDFAALQQYTGTRNGKGDFIAMYSIFFGPNPVDPASLSLGVKMMRYIADAGDNGVIDNAIQRWYRDNRDASVNPPPYGGNCTNANCTNPAHVPGAGAAQLPVNQP